MPALTARQIELAIALHFDYRVNLIVPNVSWGLLKGREADLLILTPRNWLTEVEIKTNAADIRSDLKKRHDHWDSKVKQCWFAVPEGVDTSDIEERYGIITVSPKTYRHRRHSYHKVTAVRAALINPKAKALSQKDREHLFHLGCMRIWTLKQKLDKASRKAS